MMHLPEAPGGNSPGLAAAEREIGLESEAYSVRPHPFRYDGLISMAPENDGAIARFMGMMRMLKATSEARDVLHFHFGQSVLDPGTNFLGRLPKWTGGRRIFGLIQEIELSAYRRRKIPLFVTYLGDDARQGDESLKRFPVSMATSVGVGYYTDGSDEVKRIKIARFNRYASQIFYMNPDLGWVLPKRAKFLPYTSVDPRRWRPVYANTKRDRHVVHAPSHRGAKGSQFVFAAVERLRSEGHRFKFTVVEGMSRAEAKEVYSTADIIVDQLLAGWYGGFAVECMALGKPVIAYLREDDMRFIPRMMEKELPIINAGPQTIYDVLKHWITAAGSGLEERGRNGRMFVEKWHDPLKIAKEMEGYYRKALSIVD